MKTLRIFPLIILLLTFTDYSFAQKAKTETFKVSGECGMCKKKIEKAAKDAGATYAVWNIQTKILQVTYNGMGTSVSSIQQQIANSGYDTPQYKATDDAYNKLDPCCHYQREAVNKKMNCCTNGCEMKDGKCKNEATCKQKNCCKDAETCKANGCCA
jgi:hypothetical protein